jgi:hypothetical protein
MFSGETWVLLRAGAACAVVVVVVAVIIRDRGGEPEDVTVGFLGPSLAALYLLVLAVSLATEWQTIGGANQAITSEASAVRELYWSASGMATAQGDYVREHARAYATTVINHDWPQMKRGSLDNTSERQLIVLNNYVLRIDPQNGAAVNAQLQATSQLGILFSEHDQRASSASARLPVGLIAAVIATSLVVIVFPFICGISSAPRSIGLVAMQAALVGIGIVVVFQLNHPYSGPLAVSPAPMQVVLQQLTGT